MTMASCEPDTGRPYTPPRSLASKHPPVDSYQEGGEHYLSMDIQPWHVIDDWPLDQQVGFFRGNALKYIMRSGKKGGSAGALEDARKAEHYCRKLVSALTGDGG